ncbi:DUF6612 family protein [Aquibacillus albus]|uniref:Uncharacterized protein n=1 Tax=Aquibacillus albus TaxID=1168171 RepID=A0ABS2N2P3_9BACI|nr:DUF6612 family protein [Aquibacillus albus]MBM7572372.1 hypothetical protein [Aquibacillus albus]
MKKETFLAESMKMVMDFTMTIEAQATVDYIIDSYNEIEEITLPEKAHSYKNI